MHARPPAELTAGSCRQGQLEQPRWAGKSVGRPMRADRQAGICEVTSRFRLILALPALLTPIGRRVLSLQKTPEKGHRRLLGSQHIDDAGHPGDHGGKIDGNDQGKDIGGEHAAEGQESH